MQIPAMRFPRDTSGFTSTLRARIDAHFAATGRSKQGDWRMVVKTVVMFALFFAPWAFIAFGATGGGLMFWITEIVMGLGLAGIGLNVMHDANHGAYSSNPKVNRWMGHAIDLIGANAPLWKIQHNVLHHTFTNVDGLDEDIDAGAILRFSPNQKRRWFHRFQHIYAWGFYAIMTLFWITTKDWLSVGKYQKKGLLEKSGTTRGKLFGYLAGWKALHFGYILVLPMIFSGLPVWQILVGWLVMHGVAGLLLSAIFQPAHVMEHHAFEPAVAGTTLPNDPLIHQLTTTANFGVGSGVFTWLVGGLNHQIEHHLFPNICHVHFRSIAPIVKQTAEEFGLPYRSQTTFLEALRLHTRMLRSLGRPEPSVA